MSFKIADAGWTLAVIAFIWSTGAWCDSQDQTDIQDSVVRYKSAIQANPRIRSTMCV